MLLRNPDYGDDILSKLNLFRREAAFTDAILCVGNEEFPVHRNVLAVSSPYFKAMFSSDLRESREAKVLFNEISPLTLRRLVDYAYSGQLEVTQENAQELLAAGSLFEYPAIVDICCKFLHKQLHPSNCIGIEHFAQLHSCKKLHEDSHKYTLDNFSIVVEYDEFLILPKDRLLAYISSDLIDVRSEETVYDAVMRWMHHDLSNRKQYLYEILELVRLPIVDRQYLQVIEQDSLIQSCEKSLLLVTEAQKHHESIYDQQGKRRRSMQAQQVHPRPSTVAKEVMVVVGGINGFITQGVEMFDPQKDKWSSVDDLPQPVSWYSVATVDNSILVTGGILDGRIVSNVWRFDATKRTWSAAASLLKPRARHTSASVDGKLYIIGGISYDDRVVDREDIDRYDPVTDSWVVVGQCPFPRKQSRIVPYSTTLIEIGGLQGDAKVNTLDSYLCTSSAVKTSGEQYILPEPIQFSQIVVLNRIFYIIWEDSKKVITLNPLKRTFRRLPDMHYAHIHSGATVLNGKIYITGGLVDSKPSKIVECYDPATNKWTIERSMIDPRACHGCVALSM